MDIILLEQNNSTFISNTEKDKNFSSLDYLSISNCYYRGSESQCVSLLNFNLDLLKQPEIMIHSAKLIIPLEILKVNFSSTMKEINISYNTESFSPEEVTWDTRPKSNFYTSQAITKKEIKDKCLIIDMTSLLCEWLYNGLENHGIAISTCPPDIMIILPKFKIKYSPKIIIRYSYKPENPSLASAIYIQCTNKPSDTLNAQEVFKLNDIKAITPTGISYDTETGVITISRKGYYNVHFEISLEGSNNGPDDEDIYLNIGLKNITKDTILSFNSPEVLQGKIHGNCIIDVENDGEEFVLFNNSNKVLQISNLPIQGSISISIV